MGLLLPPSTLLKVVFTLAPSSAGDKPPRYGLFNEEGAHNGKRPLTASKCLDAFASPLAEWNSGTGTSDKMTLKKRR